MREYIAVFLIIAILIPVVAADGVAMYEDDHDRWNLRPENQQLAAINYENGYENMLISVTLDDNTRGNNTVWLFPVPAKPDDVAIDILRGYPQYGGMALDHTLQETIASTATISAAYGTFPACLPLYGAAGAGFFTIQKSQMAADELSGSVVVHEHIEKMGLTTELVTAKDSASVRNYIHQKGYVLPPAAEPSIDSYIGQNYSFVISYVSNTTQFANSSGSGEMPGDSSDPDLIGVFARFPTDQIYFPLMPTSVYGSRTIPVLIYVRGFVTPVPDEKILPLTEVSYFIDRDYWYSYSREDLEKFFNYPEDFGPVRYTKIKIVAPAKYYTDDLWMNPVPPMEVRIKDTMIQYPVLFAVPLFILISMLASLAAGIVVFGRAPAIRKLLALHGLWNCGTMIGFACGTAGYLKIPKATGRQKLGFFVLFYILFIGIFTLIAFIADPELLHGISFLGEFLVILPVIGFLFGIHFFPVSPLYSIAAIVLNAAFYVVAWLTVRKFLE